ncbi:Transposase IS4 [Popillia japonica]|uniref:Transposase IS4 n=1 Tax=Popillia japonica TaxID=7064 RepID=A0AAW1N1D9_POPJA
MISEDEIPQSIAICPPAEPPDAETDKDSDLSDEEVEGNIDRLPGRILCTEVIGVMLLSGYHPLPYRRLYWSSEPDVHCELISNAIRRNRFDEIMAHLHLGNSSKPLRGDYGSSASC